MRSVEVSGIQWSHTHRWWIASGSPQPTSSSTGLFQLFSSSVHSIYHCSLILSKLKEIWICTRWNSLGRANHINLHLLYSGSNITLLWVCHSGTETSVVSSSRVLTDEIACGARSQVCSYFSIHYSLSLSIHLDLYTYILVYPKISTKVTTKSGSGSSAELQSLLTAVSLPVPHWSHQHSASLITSLAVLGIIAL